MAQTFAELAQKETVTAEELLETFRDYVTSGAAVSYPVVCALIDRVQPPETDKKFLRELARAGIAKQKKFGQARAMYDYQVVLSHLTLGPRL